ncbi:MAG TPA: MarR family transcriptional regulator [Rhabdochlamydiaceae bacterium]|jgi:DNA-binding MarR family transcriptional regulator
MKVDFETISIYKGPKQSPGFLLWHISTSWRSSIEATLKTMELTHPQFVILAAIGWLTKNAEPVTQIAIGNMVGLDPNTTSQVIKGLEHKELIKRVRSTDGRAKNVFLTPKGTKTLNRALPAVEQTDAAFFSPLSKSESSSLIDLFQKLTNYN